MGGQGNQNSNLTQKVYFTRFVVWVQLKKIKRKRTIILAKLLMDNNSSFQFVVVF